MDALWGLLGAVDASNEEGDGRNQIGVANNVEASGGCLGSLNTDLLEFKMTHDVNTDHN